MILRGVAARAVDTQDGLGVSDALRVWASVASEAGRALVLRSGSRNLAMAVQSGGLRLWAPEAPVVLTADARPMVLDTSRTEVTLSR